MIIIFFNIQFLCTIKIHIKYVHSPLKIRIIIADMLITFISLKSTNNVKKNLYMNEDIIKHLILFKILLYSVLFSFNSPFLS